MDRTAVSARTRARAVSRSDRKTGAPRIRLRAIVPLVSLAGFLAACSPPPEEESRSVSSALFRCDDPGQRLSCPAPHNPHKRFICHPKQGRRKGYVKLKVRLGSAHTPGMPHRRGGVADQAPGASANDLGGPQGLDCDCQPRICVGDCTGAANGTACDDGDRCTGNGSCLGDTCQAGAATCEPDVAVDSCNVQNGECIAESGECSTRPLPAGTPCEDGQVCDGEGACVAPPRVVINEVESNGGTPGDWVELHNAGTIPANVSGWTFLDNDDTHTPYAIPAGTVIPPGGYLVLDEASFGFGLGGADSARLFDAQGALVDSVSWTAHAATTFGRCPDGSGQFRTTTSSTRGAANDCRVLVRINEVESSGGSPGDWVELYNATPVAVDLSGWVFKDNDDTHAHVIAAGTTIAAGGYLVLDEATFGFGLGGADSARLFDAQGTLVDSFSWTTHAVTTYGRCANGTGAFRTTTNVTKGAANDCTVAVKINEIESSGGSPGDWVELHNSGAAPVDLSGWVFRDNDDTHAYVIPAGSTIPGGGYFLIEEAAMGFGLGAADSARLFDAGGALVDAFSWTAHAVTTYGRCPGGTALRTTTSVTKGAANDCSVAVRINEVESSGGTPGDWVELFNAGPVAVDLSGWVFKDNDDTHAYALPAGSTIAAGGYLVLEEAAFGFGLGSADSARLFDAQGTLIDSFSWTAHAGSTYGRCPGVDGFTTGTPTKGAANSCADAPPPAQPWPGANAVTTADGAGAFGTNLSDLFYEPAAGGGPDVLWAVRNGPSTLFRLVWNGSIWTPDSAGGWGAGKTVRYTDGTGGPDAEAVTKAEAGSSAIYVATERNNDVSSVSRLSILRYDPASPQPELSATHEWNLTADLPVVGSNLGLEAITWIPDSALVAASFFDERAGRLYDPSAYPGHGQGLFFVGVEATGAIHAYALDHDGGGFSRIATIVSGDPANKALFFDRDTGYLWTHCGAPCGGQTRVLAIDSNASSPTAGRFKQIAQFDRPTSMANIGNEGISIAPDSQCVGGFKAYYWTDDGATDGHSIRVDSIPCGRFIP